LRTEAVLRGESAQYDDALNARPLDGYVTLDLFAGYDLAEGVELYAAAENVFDKEIEVGRASNGLLTIGTPRLVRGGVRLRFCGGTRDGAGPAAPWSDRRIFSGIKGTGQAPEIGRAHV